MQGVSAEKTYSHRPVFVGRLYLFDLLTADGFIRIRFGSQRIPLIHRLVGLLFEVITVRDTRLNWAREPFH